MKERAPQNRITWVWQAALLAFLIACGLHNNPPGVSTQVFNSISPQVASAEFSPQDSFKFVLDANSQDDYTIAASHSLLLDFSPNTTHLYAYPDIRHPLTKRHPTHPKVTLRAAAILTRSDSSPPPATNDILLSSPQVFHNEIKVVHRFGRAPPSLS